MTCQLPAELSPCYFWSMENRILEVEMVCIHDPEGKRDSKVRVVTPGPYEGWYVRFSRDARVIGARYRGKVLGQTKWDADRPFCNLINRAGNVDFTAYERIS